MGQCRICQTSPRPVDRDQLCRLCQRQSLLIDGLTVEEANAGGQQLFLANLAFPAKRRKGSTGLTRRRRPARGVPAPGGFTPVTHRQLVLLELPRDLAYARDRQTLPAPRDEQMAIVLDIAVREHARQHGWPKSSTKRTRTSARVLLGLQDTPGAPLLASDALLLLQIDLPALNLIEAAGAAGLLLEDRPLAIHAWFATMTAALPDPMRGEVSEWFNVMVNGSMTPPRRRPRSEITTRVHLSWALPALTAWASIGHLSLREISPAEIRAVLPPSGNPRSTMGAGLRSIFTVLRARKTIFINPMHRIPTGGHETRDPLPLDLAVIREALHSPDPARAALAALAAFHALRAGDLLGAHLTDIQDGRLQMGDRSLPLADPVRERVSAWLDHRAQQWPRTINSHLFINHWTSTRIDPVGRRWLSLTLGIPTRLLREDRILHEIDASGGDVRRLCDLFGLTVGGALRYLPPFEASPTDANN